MDPEIKRLMALRLSHLNQAKELEKIPAMKAAKEEHERKAKEAGDRLRIILGNARTTSKVW